MPPRVFSPEDLLRIELARAAPRWSVRLIVDRSCRIAIAPEIERHLDLIVGATLRGAAWVTPLIESIVIADVGRLVPPDLEAMIAPRVKQPADGARPAELELLVVLYERNRP